MFANTSRSSPYREPVLHVHHIYGDAEETVSRLLHAWRSRACISDKPSCQEEVLRDVFLCCSQWLEPSSLCRPLKGWQTKWMTYSCIAYRREKHPARLGWCTGCTTRRFISNQMRDVLLKGMRETISVEFLEYELLVVSCCPPKDCRSFSFDHGYFSSHVFFLTAVCSSESQTVSSIFASLVWIEKEALKSAQIREILRKCLNCIILSFSLLKWHLFF